MQDTGRRSRRANDIRSKGDSRPQSDFTRRVLKAVGLTALVVLALLLLGYAAHVFLLVFAGILLAVFLRGLSRWVHAGTGLPAGWSLAAVVIALIAVVGLASWFLAARVAVQVDELAARLPQSLRYFEQQLEQYEWGRFVLAQVPTLERWMPARSNLLAGVTGFFSTTLGFLLDLVIVLFVGLYLAVEPSTYRDGLVRLVPPAGRARVREVLAEIGTTLEWWLFGRILGMIVIGVATSLGLWLLGLPFALTLGVVAGVLTFIPNIGPLLSAVPAVLLGLTISPMLALYVVLLYTGIQVTESYLLMPLVQRRTVSLPPVLTITAQVLMGVLLGGLGLLLATPLMAAVVVAVKRLYIEDTLKDYGDRAGDPTTEENRGHATQAGPSTHERDPVESRPRSA